MIIKRFQIYSCFTVVQLYFVWAKKHGLVYVYTVSLLLLKPLKSPLKTTSSENHHLVPAVSIFLNNCLESVSQVSELPNALDMHGQSRVGVRRITLAP